MDGAVAARSDAAGPLDGLTALAAATAVAVDRDSLFPEAAFAALRERRLPGMMIPRALGGLDAPLASVAEACHRLAQGCASTGMIFAMHQIQVACLLAHGAAGTWHREALARIATQQLLLGSVTSEAGVGGNIRESRCALRGVGAGRVAVEKEATTVSYGTQADMLLLTARRAPDAAPSDQMLVVLDRSDCRLERTGAWDALGMRGTCSEPFHVTAEAAEEQVLPVPFGTIATETMKPVAHILWGAVWTGIAADALARARAFLRASLRGASATAAPPDLARLAAAAETLQGAEAMIAAALRRYGEPGQHASEAAEGRGAAAMNLVKTAVSDAAMAVVAHCFAICGIAAYRNDGLYSLGRHLRDIQSAPLMVGNDRIRRNSGHLLLMGRGSGPHFA